MLESRLLYSGKDLLDIRAQYNALVRNVPLEGYDIPKDVVQYIGMSSVCICGKRRRRRTERKQKRGCRVGV